MQSRFPVAFNPLTWFTAGFDRASISDLHEIYRQIAAAGFRAAHAEKPGSLGVPDYQSMLVEAGLAAAPGYFGADFADSSQRRGIVQAAIAAAGLQAALGLDRMFMAAHAGVPARMATPAVGADADPARLLTIIENVRAAAEAMVGEGITPCLHQHVGSWIETLDETSAVLDAIEPRLLLAGPDTGHLAWAGIDPAAFIERYRGRIGAVHLKDVRPEVGVGRSYREASQAHLWTEPGRGAVDFGAVSESLGEFDGWFIIEVDVADQPTPAESARVSAAWAQEHVQQLLQDDAVA
jgi:inosose dehydratase